ncbi:MAG: quinone oxidoreductase [Gammaproteobacteria bacterium]
MKKTIRLSEFGGPEVLKWTEVSIADPGPGEARVVHTAIGVNLIDTYFRSGLYPIELPSGLGSEAAGVVAAVGNDVDHVQVGDRVAYATPPPLDGYSEERLLDARWLVKLPQGIDDEMAAAMMLKGMTSWYLLNRSYPVQAGQWIILYAAAGGVGSILCQWACSVGARVIGIVSTEEKREIALARGCEHVLLAEDAVVSRVRELTDGKGVPVVYDSIGRDTFLQSLDCLRPHGFMVSFGNASGLVEPFTPLDLQKRGSLYVTRPTLWNFIGTRNELVEASNALFDMVANGKVSIEINQRYPLASAAEAHRELEARRTTGCTVLSP